MLCLFVILIVSRLGFEGGTVVLIAPVPGHRLPFTLPLKLQNDTISPGDVTGKAMNTLLDVCMCLLMFCPTFVVHLLKVCLLPCQIC